MDKRVKDSKFEEKMGAVTISTTDDMSISMMPSPSPNGHKKERTLYERLFGRSTKKVPENTVFAPVHSCKHKEGEYESQIVVDIETHTMSISKPVRCPLPTTIPLVVLDENEKEKEEKEEIPIDLTKEMSTDQIDGMVERMQIDDEGKGASNRSMTLQWKCRYFSEDNRPSFFGVNPWDRSGVNSKEVDIQKLCRTTRWTKSRMSMTAKAVKYESDDSGVEWYDDIDDLEKLEDLDEDEEDMDSALIRADGFEDDAFIINSDDDDEEALADKDVMRKETQTSSGPNTTPSFKFKMKKTVNLKNRKTPTNC